MSDFVHKYLGYIILVMVIVLVIAGVIICNADLCSWEKYGSAIGGIASFVSIYFLYVTLNRQDRSFKQERFEITFFNLLEQRKKAIDSLSFRTEVLDDPNFVSVNHQGEECFVAICQEVQCIKESLCSDKYLGIISDSDIPSALQEYIETPDVKEMIVNEYKRYCCKRANYTYKISKEVFDSAKRLKTADEIYQKCFQLLFAHNTLGTEYYFRFQSLILSFLADNIGVGSDERYLQIYVSQMTVPELKLLYYEALVNTDFRRLMVRSGISGLVKKYLNDFQK